MKYIRKPQTVVPYVFDDTVESILAIQDNIPQLGDIRVSYKIKGKPVLIVPALFIAAGDGNVPVGGVVYVDENGGIESLPSMDVFLKFYEPVKKD